MFDYEHEFKRRQQLEKLFNRSKEQIDEELQLTEELKKIEIRKKERERKQQDVNKLLTAVVDLENTNKFQQQQQLQQLLAYKEQQKLKQNGAINSSSNKRIKQRKQSNDTSLTQANTSISSASNKQQSIKLTSNSLSGSTSSLNKLQTGNDSLNSSTDGNNLSPSSNALSVSGELKDAKNSRKSLIFKAVVESTGIKFPDNKVAGVTLRSYKMKLPPSVGLKKMKAIEQLLEELQVDGKPIATEAICDQFNDLRSDIVLLYELQQALNNCEFELQTIRHKYEPVLSTKNIDMSLFETSLPQAPLAASALATSIAPSNTPQKRISELFDTGTPSLQSSLVSFEFFFWFKFDDLFIFLF